MKYIFSITILCLAGVAAVVFIEREALLRGVDGVSLAASTAAIGALVGYTFKTISYLKRKEVGKR